MEYKWKAFSVTSIGSLMAAIDGTIVLLALLPIAQDLSSSYVTIIWVVIAYLLATTALVLSFGRISDIYGRKRMYNVGFVIFTIGSALCGFAITGLDLVGFRALQGVGAALLTANSFAILSEAFPPGERGRAFGSTAIVWGVGAALGIVLGGVIITFTTWRLIFWINIPIGIVGTIWAYRSLRESKSADSEGETFDLPAAILFTGALTSLLVGVTWGLLYGWTIPGTLLAFALVVPLFVAFVVWEIRYSKDPIVDFAFFRERTFALATCAAMLQSIAIFSVNFLLVFYLEGIYGLSVLDASLLILPNAVAVAVVGPFGGRLSDRVGNRRIATIGLILQIGVLLAFSLLTTNTPIWLLAIAEAIFGVGGGLFWPASTSMIMSASPRGRYGVGSGIMNTFRNTGMVLSFAVSLVAITTTLSSAVVYALFIGTFSGALAPAFASEYLSGQSLAFLISAGLLIGALVLMRLTRPHAPSAAQRYEVPAAGPESL
ncbi:MAG: MFS transporter [Thermoplasmata archaeon]|nr:MFS transporter [Thermoplasmata archaeon]